jgi:hypothetical protein
VKWLKHSTYMGGESFSYNLDRKDNSKGYTKSNCCVCCSICNAVKSDRFTHEEMVKLGHTIRAIRKDRTCSQ